MDARKVDLDQQDAGIHFEPFQGRTNNCNKCWCKHCAYHCQLCFLQKGLGIRYNVSRPRKRTASVVSRVSETGDTPVARTHTAQRRPTTTDSQTKKKEKSKTEESGISDQSPPSQNLQDLGAKKQ
ncbi:tat protein [Simian immunodeficiency virus]|uniref:Protein Tat n=1 Tax=Simian immunodeficiency virus TaxID=11723 RepID=A0A0A7RWP6_SIV|nr:tat protein [Simian immunodeficiency virus]